MKKYYYAIKVGRNVKDKIVTSWDECKIYVIGFPSIYKKFLSKNEAKNYLKNISEDEIPFILAQYKNRRFQKLKEKLEIKYHSYIPYTIAEAIINNDTFENLSLLLNNSINENMISKRLADIILKNYQY